MDSVNNADAIRRTATLVFIVFLLVIASVGVRSAAERGLLVATALPGAAVLIVALRVLGREAELLGWAAFTGWLGVTYALGGRPQEIAVFFLCVVLAGLGIFKSSWFIAAAWAAHIAWDFVPRPLPPEFEALPVACMLFDGLIAAYLGWLSSRKRWAPFGAAAAAAV